MTEGVNSGNADIHLGIAPAEFVSLQRKDCNIYGTNDSLKYRFNAVVGDIIKLSVTTILMAPTKIDYTLLRPPRSGTENQANIILQHSLTVLVSQEMRCLLSCFPCLITSASLLIYLVSIVVHKALH